ncbi:hypothetical protein GOP47_0021400 [Adiantum capillus-veneris]|uniref:Uncharacterized protein n=1 Tax=Adiantum capillus-veneris TaxID=13818 RepID=A0A9D4U8A5_ADICA|nr:hypothetical protein GOP47_0021400 [Adiantum capillus-veneris]
MQRAGLRAILRHCTGLFGATYAVLQPIFPSRPLLPAMAAGFSQYLINLGAPSHREPKGPRGRSYAVMVWVQLLDLGGSG